MRSQLARLARAARWIGPLAALGCGAADSPDPPAPRPLPPDTPVVLVVVDTLRADRLGAYGCDLGTSPELDALARRSFVFESHVTQCNSTFPSMTSILTGLYPKTHHNYVAVPADGAVDDAAEWATLAERLRDRGYFTAAVWSHPMWDIHREESPVHRGWDFYSVIEKPRGDERNYAGNAAFTNERIERALAAYDAQADRPLFLWAHYFDPHGPYDPPLELANLFLGPHLAELGLEAYAEALAAVPVRERAAWVEEHAREGDLVPLRLANGRALYDAEIRYMDGWIARLFGELEQRGVLEDALVMFLADHGENMGHSGRAELAFNHDRLFEGVIATPLLVRLPGQADGRRVRALSQNIDVLPTVLDLLGSPDESVDGRSLAPILRGQVDAVHGYVFTECSDLAERAVKSPDHKLIDPGDGSDGLFYAWREDPHERRSLPGPEVRREELGEALQDFRPPDVLRLDLQPAAAPYEASIRLRVPGTRIVGYEGPPTGTVSADRHAFQVRHEVGAEPVTLRLELEHLRSRMTWQVDLGGGAEARRVRIGPRELRRSPVLPVLGARTPEPPADPVLVVTHGDDDVDLAVHAPPGAPVELEWRFVRAGYGQLLEPLATEGFGELQRVQGGSYRQRGTGGSALRSHVRSTGGEPVSWNVRIDGAWVEPGRVAVDGRGVAVPDEIGFVFPNPPDGRITSALLAGPAEPPQPGSLTLWLESGGQRADLDLAGLDDATLETLRALGYVR